MEFLISEHWTDGTVIALKDDLVAGFTIAMTQIPQSVAFAVIGKMNPMRGLYSTFYLGLIMACFGARSGAIYGAAGALAVVFPHMVEDYGAGSVLAATILCGFLCVWPAIFRITTIIRLLPNSVMIGFLNGLAIVIFLGTLSNFKTPATIHYLNVTNATNHTELHVVKRAEEYITGAQAGYTILICLVTLLLMLLLPKISKKLPSVLIAIIIGSALEHIFGLGTVLVGDKYSLNGALSAPELPDMSWDGHTVGVVIREGFVMAIIGAIESLMTQLLLDKRNENKSNMDREMFVFGLANIWNGFFGGMAGCALVGPTILNLVSGGGKRRISGVLNALLTLIAIYAAASAVEVVPLGALASVTFIICMHTFDWKTFIHIFRIPYNDSFVILTVTVVTVFTDLAIAVGCGLVVALLTNAFKLRHNVVFSVNASPVLVPARKSVSGNRGVEHGDLGIVHVKLSGTLFFPAAPSFIESGEALLEHPLIAPTVAATAFKEEEGSPLADNPFEPNTTDKAEQHEATDEKNEKKVIPEAPPTSIEMSQPTTIITDVVFDLEHCLVQDFAALEALEEVASILGKKKIRTHLKNYELLSGELLHKGRLYLAHVVPNDISARDFVNVFVTDPNVKPDPVELPFPFSTVDNMKCHQVCATAYVYRSSYSINVPLVVPCFALAESEAAGEQQNIKEEEAAMSPTTSMQMQKVEGVSTPVLPPGQPVDPASPMTEFPVPKTSAVSEEQRPEAVAEGDPFLTAKATTGATSNHDDDAEGHPSNVLPATRQLDWDESTTAQLTHPQKMEAIKFLKKALRCKFNVLDEKQHHELIKFAAEPEPTLTFETA